MKTLHKRVIAEAVVGVKPFVEVVRAFKDVGQEEVEQGPELVEVVLQRGSGEQKPVARFDLANDEGEFGLFVLDSVGLIDDHVLPVELLEDALLSDEHLVGGDDDVPTAGHHRVADELVPSFLF